MSRSSRLSLAILRSSFNLLIFCQICQPTIILCRSTLIQQSNYVTMKGTEPRSYNRVCVIQLFGPFSLAPDIFCKVNKKKKKTTTTSALLTLCSGAIRWNEHSSFLAHLAPIITVEHWSSTSSRGGSCIMNQTKQIYFIAKKQHEVEIN